MATDHETWPPDPHWDNSASTPFTGNERLKYLVPTDGPSWIKIPTLIRDFIGSLISGTTGQMAYLDTPPAPPGATGGVATVVDLAGSGMAGQIIMAGNSQGTKSQYAYVARLCNLFNPIVNGAFPVSSVVYRQYEYQTPSKTTAAFLNDGVNYAGLYANGLPAGTQFFVFSEIINHLFYGASGQEAYDKLVELLTPIKAAGFKVIIHAPTFRNDAGTPSDYETKRAFVLAKLRADFNTTIPAATDSQYILLAKAGGNGYGDEVIDLDADPAFASGGSGDGVHWNEAQSIRAANLTYQGAQALIPPALTAITVTLDAPGSDGKIQAHAAPNPPNAILGPITWSEEGQGSITIGGLLTPPTPTTIAQAGAILAKSGSIVGVAPYVVQSSNTFDADAVYKWNIEGQPIAQIKGYTETHRITVSCETRTGGYLDGAQIVGAGLEICFLEDASDLDNTDDNAPNWYPLDVDPNPIPGLTTRHYAYIDADPATIQEIEKADTYTRYVRVSALPARAYKIGDLTVTAE